jgi:hypothetical protein
LRRVLFNAGVEWRTFVHLTYPADFPKDGRIVKRHLHAFLDAARRLGMRFYVWVLEFQSRGAPHFHLLADLGREQGFSKEWVAVTWARVAGADQRAGTRVDAVYDQARAVAYLVAYLAKVEQKVVPAGFENVGRMWGASRGLGRPLETGALDWHTGARVARAVRVLLRRRGVRLRRCDGGGCIYGGASVLERLLRFYGAGLGG